MFVFFELRSVKTRSQSLTIGGLRGQPVKVFCLLVLSGGYFRHEVLSEVSAVAHKQLQGFHPHLWLQILSITRQNCFLQGEDGEGTGPTLETDSWLEDLGL